jgi:NAD(P)-dependent dehydrogenase (short-subunit alcohol dehydrogenase family)
LPAKSEDIRMDTGRQAGVTDPLLPKAAVAGGAALTSFPQPGVAAVFGAGGGIGAALVEAIRATGRFSQVIAFSRSTSPAIDLLDEASLERAARLAAGAADLRLVIDATGFLHDEQQSPEKSWQELDASRLGRAFTLNAIGPALLMKHVLPRLAPKGKAVFATLSARVGSIGDNRLGGWYAYRASKAALNQLVRTAAIELSRRRPEALCVALHPGTVATPLSAPFAKDGLEVHDPAAAAQHLLAVVDGLGVGSSGGFFDWRGHAVPW